MTTLVTKDKEIKKNDKDNSDVKNLSGGKDPNEVKSSVDAAPLSRQKLSKSIDQTNSLIQTRIAKGGEVGVIQSLSAETLTDVNKRIKDFAPKLSDQEVQRVIRLSQGDAQDVSDAIKLLSDKTGKPYQDCLLYTSDAADE